MKKAGLRLLNPSLDMDSARKNQGINSLKGVAPMNSTIMAYAATPVKPQMPVASKRRVVRQDMTISEIEPCYRAMARHIDKQLKRKQPVRIPAMNNHCLGQLLRCLELRKSWI